MLKTLRLTQCFIATDLFRVIKFDHTNQASYIVTLFISTCLMSVIVTFDHTKQTCSKKAMSQS